MAHAIITTLKDTILNASLKYDTIFIGAFFHWWLYNAYIQCCQYKLPFFTVPFALTFFNDAFNIDIFESHQFQWHLFKWHPLQPFVHWKIFSLVSFQGICLCSLYWFPPIWYHFLQKHNAFYFRKISLYDTILNSPFIAIFSRHAVNVWHD